MDWYYAQNNSQQGPVGDEQFESLVRSGSIQPATMVWRDGLPDWQPLSVVRPDLLGSAANLASPLGAGALKDLNVQALREGINLAGTLQGLQYAGFWIRFAAKVIDMVLLTVVNYAIMAVFMIPAVALSNGGNEPPAAAIGAMIFAYVLMLLIPLAYNSLMVAKYGATVGKMACGLKVVLADGSPPAFGRALGRAAAEMLSQCTMYIGYILAAFDEEKRSLHDHIASTRVIRIR